MEEGIIFHVLTYSKKENYEELYRQRKEGAERRLGDERENKQIYKNKESKEKGIQSIDL